jgi:Spy/CpxP family protein refolding chaperone
MSGEKAGWPEKQKICFARNRHERGASLPVDMNTPTKRYRPSLMFAIGALLAGLPAAYAEETAAPAGETRREKMEKGGDRLADALGLSDDQRAKFKVINEQERAELKTLRSDTTLSDEDRRAKAGGVRQKFKDQRDALLTPEQKAKADKMHARMEKRRDKDGGQPAAK